MMPHAFFTPPMSVLHGGKAAGGITPDFEMEETLRPGGVVAV